MDVIKSIWQAFEAAFLMLIFVILVELYLAIDV